ncbi:hypothetical protein BH20BAC1_BH20BAC1_15630 [soil metagenome]
MSKRILHQTFLNLSYPEEARKHIGIFSDDVMTINYIDSA